MNTITRGLYIPWQIHCMHLHAILIRMHVFNYLCPQHKLNRLIFRLFYYHVCTYQYFQFKTILHQRTKVIFFQVKEILGSIKTSCPEILIFTKTIKSNSLGNQKFFCIKTILRPKTIFGITMGSQNTFSEQSLSRSTSFFRLKLFVGPTVFWDIRCSLGKKSFLVVNPF